MKARRDTVLGGAAIPVNAANGAIDGFGPLKAVLEVIYAVYVDSQVRLRLPVQNPSLTNPSAGNCLHWKQDQRPPLTYSHARRPFRNAS